MKAIVMNAVGAPEVLEPGELPDPVAGPLELLVRVRACGLNHLDVWIRKGQAGRPVPFPHVLGCDIAGEIAALGPGVKGVEVGQRVMLQPGTSCGRCHACLAGDDNACREYRLLGYQVHGGYAQLVRCPAANAIALPDRIAIEEAAAFPLVFLTAWHMLFDRARLRRDEDVLVWAAGSGVGTAAIQIAKFAGARVIATAGSDAKLELARGLGADHVLNHRTADVAAEVKRLTGKKGADVVFEHVGEATWERSILSLAHRGRLVTCGATTGPRGVSDLRHVFSKQLSLLGSYMGRKAELLEAAQPFFAGRFRSVVHAALPLADARRAHEMLEASEHFGKIVLLV
jgi:NADPH:quinone reductase-like Zn-dependent oxidoreductase